ncbi:radical SAM protein [Candidatus Bipolaricaulota bacterium]|nr:radical SAM protein [Candidatus Bipolaricaulota bacterium]
MKAYGPVPSRRLGRSLGINNIPPKTCTYSCVYCQLGRTDDLKTDRTNFYDTEKLKKEVEEKVSRLEKKDEEIDYLSFVPDGEPTLDVKLGKEIKLVSEFGIDVAVISNASLIADSEVRSDLAEADWVSLKVDAVSEDVWRKVNRPAGSLELANILEGIEVFSREFGGTLATETMLIKGVNDKTEEFEKIANFIGQISPDESYIAIPTRPPAEDRVSPADEEKINRAYQEFSKRVGKVEYLIGYEGNQFTSTGDFEEDVLSITAVHPMREEGVEELVNKSGDDWKLVEKLVEEGKLVRHSFEKSVYYMRKLPKS